MPSLQNQSDYFVLLCVLFKCELDYRNDIGLAYLLAEGDEFGPVLEHDNSVCLYIVFLHWTVT